MPPVNSTASDNHAALSRDRFELTAKGRAALNTLPLTLTPIRLAEIVSGTDVGTTPDEYRAAVRQLAHELEKRLPVRRGEP